MFALEPEATQKNGAIAVIGHRKKNSNNKTNFSNLQNDQKIEIHSWHSDGTHTTIICGIKHSPKIFCRAL